MPKLFTPKFLHEFGIWQRVIAFNWSPEVYQAVDLYISIHKLLQDPPQGEMLKRGRDFKGFIFKVRIFYGRNAFLRFIINWKLITREITLLPRLEFILY